MLCVSFGKLIKQVRLREREREREKRELKKSRVLYFFFLFPLWLFAFLSIFYHICFWANYLFGVILNYFRSKKNGASLSHIYDGVYLLNL